MQPNGFIKLHRKIIDWEWYDDINTKTLFIHILLMANYEDRKWHGETVKRGSFLTSYQTLATQTGLTMQQVRTSIKKLLSTNDITKVTSNKNTVIIVPNYNLYQSVQQTEEQTNNIEETNEQHSNNIQVTTTKNIKNKKNIKNNTFIGACAQDDVWSVPLLSLFEEEFGRTISSNEAMLISQMENDYDDLLIRYALREAMTRGKKSVQYIDRILVDWKQRDFTTKDYEEGKR